MSRGSTIVLHLLRVALGLFFLFVGLLKLRDLDAFTEDIFNYQILFPPYDGYAAYFVAWLEVWAGLAVLVGRRGLLGGLILVAGMLATFITALSIAAAKGLNINCGCFGSSDEPTNFPLHIGMNAALLAVTALLVCYQVRTGQSSLGPKIHAQKLKN
jgi:uncharacterized membrane protein YphA (DoxX/SURF4 family)